MAGFILISWSHKYRNGFTKTNKPTVLRYYQTTINSFDFHFYFKIECKPGFTSSLEARDIGHILTYFTLYCMSTKVWAEWWTRKLTVCDILSYVIWLGNFQSKISPCDWSVQANESWPTDAGLSHMIIIIDFFWIKRKFFAPWSRQSSHRLEKSIDIVRTVSTQIVSDSRVSKKAEPTRKFPRNLGRWTYWENWKYKN